MAGVKLIDCVHYNGFDCKIGLFNNITGCNGGGCNAYSQPLKHYQTDAKHDNGKPDWSMLDLSLVEEIVKVFDMGAVKHGRDSWKKEENAVDRNFAALMRHITDYQYGQIIDKESGLSNMAHAAWRCLALMHFERKESKGDK